MSAYGDSVNAEDGQLAQVDFLRWLMKTDSRYVDNRKEDTAAAATVDDQKTTTTTTTTATTVVTNQPSANMDTSTISQNDHPIDKPIKQISCVQCQQRKIKCDKQKPSCTHCIKSKLGPCEYRPPAPPRRGKRKPTEADLLSRLRRCEELLAGSGIKVDEDGNVDSAETTGANLTTSGAETIEPPPAKRRLVVSERANGSSSSSPAALQTLPDAAEAHSGRVIVEEGGPRYVESDLWRGIGAQTNQISSQKLSSVDHSGDDTTDLNNGDFLFEVKGTRASLASFHPSITDAQILWDTFLDNVEPLLKVLHVPTFEPEIMHAMRNIDAIPSGLEALMFAIYTIAITSMPPSECERVFGIAKSILLAQFESAVKKAFVKAGILVSIDFRLVQAIVIWLHAIRDTYHPHALWILSGIALRTAQRLGIHREKALANFSIFEAEMRRRTWWALMAIDSRAAELSGSGLSGFHNVHDTNIPRNLNDCDLSPDMQELPPDRTGATDMIFVSLRHEVANFFKQNLSRVPSENGVSSHPHVSNIKIDDFEQLLEHKFLRFCDALYPLHYITSVVGRACIGTLRLTTQHPIQYTHGCKDMSEEARDSLYQQSVKLMRYQHLVVSTPALNVRYLWHCDAYFPWLAFIYVVTSLCRRDDKKKAQEAWELVNKNFEIYPKMIDDTRKPLHVALGNLVIRAWDVTGDWFPGERLVRTPGRSSGSSPQHQSNGALPNFILKLRAQRAPRLMPMYPAQTLSTNGSSSISNTSTGGFRSQPTTPGVLAANAMQYNSGMETYHNSANGIESFVPDALDFNNVDFSPEAWADWDKLLANSQTLDFSSEFQNAGNWSMYGGLD